ncbi:hypothetical protein [Companilactobacillus bobalius]|uniref:Uncharacterized protein n=2 Tax=Companilactobacillus bobalius TaxID=2801451 RepID=A0A202FAN2_9LACO|nr:hypothetical protein [Companilactobacillus bobalius]KAE9557915.1 hypothetical protein ATN92_14950 [Companilactobacillus bobalius]KAE9559168.1 hypothetical protein ATN92_12585 [Companilactobacillus bobalius]KAE9563026.1 hypothetical protein ATN92_04010 [Companilactobacillus bobalius]KAE9564457.1 hypothetical protein ATN92_00520 [Companilactobacillus bobalius]KRK81454.1 hypothetical protein FC78_GL000504 [Companilactobacillus bobalius DSM 19674]
MIKINNNLTKADWKYVFLLLKKNNILSSFNKRIRFCQFLSVISFSFIIIISLLDDPHELTLVKLIYSIQDLLAMIFCIFFLKFLMWKIFINKNVQILAKKDHTIFFDNGINIDKRSINNSSYGKFKYIIDSDYFYILVRPIKIEYSLKKRSQTVLPIVPIKKNKNTLNTLPSTDSIFQLLGYKIPNIIKV